MIEGISSLLEVRNRELISRYSKIVLLVSLVSLAIIIPCMHIQGFPHGVSDGLIKGITGIAQTAFLTWICVNYIHFSRQEVQVTQNVLVNYTADLHPSPQPELQTD